ncbi:aldo/keto reductase [Actinospica sp. MGRD01-02]|uniref:Aldo/keto reductase n=1 Tax=Actinospica acidithermotolerans TaxID=2828514 RepID=A0A941IIY3_9ACTN|nr:aldo/keto reductase [Actinospica acidithermotolerans]MBR7825221.1 aldo/keto reductase [Actinospica acidithermotolerans]
MSKLGTTDLDVYGLCLGGNVFGWTADEASSFAILDAYAQAGGNFIDTADAYGHRVNGEGGLSEELLGRWFASRGNRSSIVLATKVAAKKNRPGLGAANILAAADESLARLGTDYIDLYYAHRDDPEVPLEETLGAFDELVRAGKVRYIAASNYTAPRLAEALAVSEREGFARYSALQNHYNLLERAEYEADTAPFLAQESIPSLPYFGLARGFLAGKYRPGVEVESVRAEGVAKYRDERGYATLAVLDEVAAAHKVPVASVSLAWLAAQPTVAAPIASARTVDQLAELLPSVGLTLSAEEIAALNSASA